MTSTTEAEDFKKIGNEAFIAKDYDTAIDNYKKEIEIEPENHVGMNSSLYSNV